MIKSKPVARTLIMFNYSIPQSLNHSVALRVFAPLSLALLLAVPAAQGADLMEIFRMAQSA
ncbi:MAG: hypothetical protein ACREVR_00205, partial [Burkholderiales bacterium]